VAHSPQNFCPSGFSWPQVGHTAIVGAYAMPGDPCVRRAETRKALRQGLRGGR
jgi:hypothetical protein